VDFKVVWKVKNIGTKEWDKNSVDYLYSSGDKFHTVAGYDLPKTVGFTETIDLGADMQSPKSPGTYTTNWAMQVSGDKFCTMSLTIVVK